MATPEQIAANRKNALKAGRKKGSLSKKTMEQKEAQEWFRQQVIKELPALWEKALQMAKGWEEEKIDYYDTYENIGGKVRKIQHERPVFIKHKPDFSFMNALLERGLGKQKDGLDNLGDGIKELTMSIKKILEQ